MTTVPDRTPAAAGGSGPRSTEERPELLAAMVRDAKGQPGIYQPGPYWRSKTEAAVRQIERHGLSDFRGYESGVRTSFTDSVLIDFRSELDTRLRRPLKVLFDRVFRFSVVR